MARPPVGTVTQAKSRTALFGYIASRLAGVSVAGQATFYARDLGIKLGRAGADAAAAQRRHEQPGRRPRGPAGSRPKVPAENAAIRDWLLVEEHKLDLDTALVRFPGVGSRQSDLLNALARMRGVRQLLELAQERDVVAIVVFDGRRDRVRLRAELEELNVSMTWEDIECESHLPARGTWKHLARLAATAENLLK